MTALEKFADIVRRNKAGEPVGIYSVCSAHEGVIRACMKQALEDGSVLLLESTSNQVDQYGGYTGMMPADFVAFAGRLAAGTGFPKERLLLGGDHLGPNAWRNENADSAMEKARELVRRYVLAGYGKIHLDASMFLADDEGDRTKPLADETVASRAASLCAVAENAWKSLPVGSPAPLYVIGTEVPVPGGAVEHEEGVGVTPAADARRTVEVTRKAFLDAGLSDAWERVCALVVQPGVEFGDDQVFDYDPEAAEGLVHALDGVPGLVFEAHSTDYQTPKGLASMAEGHFCIQKVGPWLTYAWREALFALADIETEALAGRPTSRLREVLEEVMLDNPAYWEKYYPGTAGEQFLKRRYSYSDRSRYYWPDERLAAAVKTLFANLRAAGPSPTLYSQHLPSAYRAWRAGSIDLDPECAAENHVREVARIYSAACRMGAAAAE